MQEMNQDDVSLNFFTPVMKPASHTYIDASTPSRHLSVMQLEQDSNSGVTLNHVTPSFLRSEGGSGAQSSPNNASGCSSDGVGTTRGRRERRICMRGDPQQQLMLQQRNVYISGLPSDYRVSDFKALCSAFGQIESLKLSMEGEGSSVCKGYGFVLYSDVASATACIAALNGMYMRSKQLQVRRADLSASPQPFLRHHTHGTEDGEARAGLPSNSTAYVASTPTTQLYLPLPLSSPLASAAYPYMPAPMSMLMPAYGASLASYAAALPGFGATMAPAYVRHLAAASASTSQMSPGVASSPSTGVAGRVDLPMSCALPMTTVTPMAYTQAGPGLAMTPSRSLTLPSSTALDVMNCALKSSATTQPFPESQAMTAGSRVGCGEATHDPRGAQEQQQSQQQSDCDGSGTFAAFSPALFYMQRHW